MSVLMMEMSKKIPLPGSIVHEGVLHEGAEDEEDTHPGPDVHRLVRNNLTTFRTSQLQLIQIQAPDWQGAVECDLSVCHGRERGLDGGHGGGHGEQRGDAQVHTGRGLGDSGGRRHPVTE